MRRRSARDALAGGIVIAIFDLGQNVYAIRRAGRGGAEDRALAEPIIVGKNSVYSVIEFPSPAQGSA